MLVRLAARVAILLGAVTTVVAAQTREVTGRVTEADQPRHSLKRRSVCWEAHSSCGPTIEENIDSAPLRAPSPSSRARSGSSAHR
jgi:hypothetical protein